MSRSRHVVAKSAARDVTDPAPVSLAELEAELTASMSKPGWRMDSGTTTGVAAVEDQAARLRAIVANEGPEVPVLQPALARRDDEVPVMAETAIAPLTIAVASGKGGVGKTNLAVNLAAALAARGHRVTLLDADLGTANADVICGLAPSARLDHVLTGPLEVHDAGRRTLRDILIEAPGGFRLIPGSAGIARMADLDDTDRRRLFRALGELDHDTDVLIIDTAAGVGSSVTSFVDAADTCLVVSTPEPTSVADAYALIKCGATTASGLNNWSGGDAWSGLRGVGGAGGRGEGPVAVPRFQLVMNQCVDAIEARRVAARIGAVCDRFLGLSVPMLGWVAQDVRVGEAVRARQPLVLRSPASEAARNISSLAGALAQQLDLPKRQAAAGPSKLRLASALRRLLRVGPSA